MFNVRTLIIDKNKPAQSIFRFLLGLFSIAMIIAYVSYLLGSRYFILPTEGFDNVIVGEILTFLLFIVNMFFLSGICLKGGIKQNIKVALCFVPILFVSGFIKIDISYKSFVLPFVYVLVWGFILKKPVNVLKSIVLTYVIIALYQYVSTYIKLNTFYFSYIKVNFIQGFLYSIDLLIFMVILLIVRGGTDVWLVLGNTDKYSLSAEKVNFVQQDSDDDEAIDALRKLIGKERIIATILLAGFQLLQLFIVLGVSLLGNTLAECAIIHLSFWLFGIIFKDRWHSKSLVVCTCASAAIFYTASKVSLPFSISIFVPIIIGLLISYALFRVALHYREWERKDLFDISTCTEIQMRDKCRAMGKGKEYADFCVMAFVEKRRRKEIAEIIGCAEETVKKYKQLRKKELMGN